MGLNSIHLKYKDYIRCENITKGTAFYCQIKTKGFERMQVVQRINASSVQCVLIISGYAEISEGDMIRVPSFSDDLKVVSTLATNNEILFRKRTDYSNFTGDMEVALL